MEERDFFEEKSEQRKHTLTCPHCGKAEEYEVAWLVRRKKTQLPGRADERDRARDEAAMIWPGVRRYEKKSGRVIPYFRMVPTVD